VGLQQAEHGLVRAGLQRPLWLSTLLPKSRVTPGARRAAPARCRNRERERGEQRADRGAERARERLNATRVLDGALQARESIVPGGLGIAQPGGRGSERTSAQAIVDLTSGDGRALDQAGVVERAQVLGDACL